MNLAQTLTALALKLRDERQQRWRVEESDDYRSAQAKIDKLREQMESLVEYQKSLLLKVPDSTEEYEEAKRRLIEEMKAKGIENVENVAAKVRVSREVDTRRLMEGLHGDLEHFFLLAKVQQNTLKDFCKDNTSYKHLKRCIVETGREIVDVTVSLPE